MSEPEFKYNPFKRSKVEENIKPSYSDGDSDDDVDFGWSSSRRRGTKSRSAYALPSNRKMPEVKKLTNSKISSVSSVLVLDENDSSLLGDRQAQVEEEVRRLLPSYDFTADNDTGAEEIVSLAAFVDDTEYKRAQELRSMLQEACRKADEEYKMQRLAHASRPSASSNVPLSIEKASFPVVATASERLEEQHKRMGSYIEDLIGPSITTAQQPEDCKVTMIKLKTRLNDKHEWKFKIPRNDPISKLKAKFASIYGLTEVHVRFEFDGESIKDNDSPESLGLDDDDLIHVKVNADLWENAVATAEKSRITTKTSFTDGSQGSEGSMTSGRSFVQTQNDLSFSFRLLIAEEIPVADRTVDIKLDGNQTVGELHRRVSLKVQLPTLKGYKYSYFAGENRLELPKTLNTIFIDRSPIYELRLQLESAKVNVLLEFDKLIQIVAIVNVPCCTILQNLCSKLNVVRDSVEFFFNGMLVSDHLSFEEQGISERSKIKMIKIIAARRDGRDAMNGIIELE